MINTRITPYPNDAPNENTQSEAEFNTNAISQAAHYRVVLAQYNQMAVETNALAVEVNAKVSQAEIAASQSAISASSAASSASSANNSRANAENSATTAQGIVNGLDGLQYALSQIGIGFAGLSDAELIINYADPITNVSLTNGELSITY